VLERTRELIKANANLERSNTELEQFAFAASHDLQEPLRKIQVFTNLLIDKNKDNLNAESKTYLDKIDSAANKMTRLINDLLNFSKLSKDNEPFIGVDLNKVLEGVRNDFDLLIKQKGAMVKWDRLPVIEGIQLQMNQLFYNLIGNALKFQKDGVSPVISITCSELSSEEIRRHSALDKNLLQYQIDIKDNGIGFDPQFSKQIFSIFQRLNNKAVYEGSGIGLALCKKIVNNHHGEIYAESSEGEGAVFSVILPAKQK
jgi:two-component system CheB/CheR fusion protein